MKDNLFNRDRDATCAWDCTRPFPHEGPCSTQPYASIAEAVSDNFAQIVQPLKFSDGGEMRCQCEVHQTCQYCAPPVLSPLERYEECIRSHHSGCTCGMAPFAIPTHRDELLRLGERAARYFADGTRTDEPLDVETAIKCVDGALGALEQAGLLVATLRDEAVELLAELDAQRATVARLTADYDKVLTAWAESRERHIDAEREVARLTQRAEAAEQETARLKAALFDLADLVQATSTIETSLELQAQARRVKAALTSPDAEKP